MPGRYPARALSRKHSLEERNFFKTPLPRPVNWQRLRRRTGHVSRGILFRLIRAARRSSSVMEGSIARFLSSWRFSQCLATRISRFFCRFTTDFFAILRTILYFFLAGPFWRCFRVGSFLFRTYTLPLRRTVISPFEGTAFTEARTFMCILYWHFRLISKRGTSVFRDFTPSCAPCLYRGVPYRR